MGVSHFLPNQRAKYTQAFSPIKRGACVSVCHLRVRLGPIYTVYHNQTVFKFSDTTQQRNRLQCIHASEGTDRAMCIAAYILAIECRCSVTVYIIPNFHLKTIILVCAVAMQTRSSLFNLHSAATIKSIEQNDGPYDTLETPMREATHLSMNSSFSVPSSQWPHTDGTLSNGSSLTASESTFSSTQTNTDKLMKRLSVLHHVIDLLLACALLYAGLARITIPSLIYFFGFFLGFMNPFGLKSHTLLLPKCIAAFGWTVLIMDGVLIILRSSSKLRDSVVQHMIWVHSRPSWMELYGIDLFVTMYATFYCVVAYPWLNARARVYSYRAFGRIIEVTEEQKIRRESQSVLLPLYCHLSYHIEVTASRGVDENTVRAPGMSIRWLEIWIAQLLLISSTSVPTLSTGIYYLILLERFLQWTYYAKSLTIEQLQKTDSRRILLGTRRFVGDKTAMVVLIVAHLWLHLLYVSSFHTFAHAMKADILLRAVIFTNLRCCKMKE